MMHEEVVHKRAWLSEQEFLDYLGATNFIPGPNSTEMAIHIGHRKAGWLGLIIAGACFIFPAAIIVTVIAWAYVKFGKLPQVEGLLYGIKPVVIAVIVQALWRLAHMAVKSKWLAVVGTIAVVLTVIGINELLVLAIGGALAVAVNIKVNKTRRQHSLWAPLLMFSPTAASAATAGTSAGLWPIFLVFAKIGSVLFGSGYVLLAFLRADFVERYHWLTQQQLLDAVAVGQVTPGPVFTTATFIGYILHGGAGALLATVGIFLPAFILVAVTAPLLPKLRSSPTAGHILDGINVASLALMLVVTWQLTRSAIVDGLTLVLAVGCTLLLLRFQKVNSVWLILAAAMIGILRRMIVIY